MSGAVNAASDLLPSRNKKHFIKILGQYEQTGKTALCDSGGVGV